MHTLVHPTLNTYIVKCHPFTDTAVKLAATKAVAADANATAIDVLERLGDLNLQLHGLQSNYSDLEDTVKAANDMIQDPEKNSKAPHYWLFYNFTQSTTSYVGLFSLEEHCLVLIGWVIKHLP